MYVNGKLYGVQWKWFKILFETNISILTRNIPYTYLKSARAKITLFFSKQNPQSRIMLRLYIFLVKIRCCWTCLEFCAKVSPDVCANHQLPLGLIKLVNIVMYFIPLYSPEQIETKYCEVLYFCFGNLWCLHKCITLAFRFFILSLCCRKQSMYTLRKIA